MVFVSSRNGGEVIVRKLQDGFQVPGDSFLAPMRSSAARAALDLTGTTTLKASSLLHLFRANYSWGRRARPLGAHLDIVGYKQGGRVRRHRRYWPETDVG
ncbi:hypothetical protein B7H19_16505, partial [Pseudomonas putida]|uniref:hypothetical protein n=1 Tax=Pseudomonas putida TaxID=303 RepID=UPI000A24C404